MQNSVRSVTSDHYARYFSVIVIFLVSIFIPISFNLAGTLMSPNRLVLLVAFFPTLFMVLGGLADRINLIDILLLCFGLWVIIALFILHGSSRLNFAILTTLEMVGGYLVGRVLVRNADTYRAVFRFLFIVIIFLLPFTIYENFSGRLIIPDFFKSVLPVETPVKTSSANGRLGLERVFSVFPHPILWGLFCGLVFANMVVLVRSKARRFFVSLILIYSAFSALSSAPLLALALQVGLFAWGWVTNGRWKLLGVVLASLYVFIDMASNRTPVTIIIDTLTFSSHTGWTRVAIFEYAWAAIKQNPILGVGFNGYERPEWLTASVDNFWLVIGILHGLIALGILCSALTYHIWRAANVNFRSEEMRRLRLGHVIGLIGLSFTLTTVHIWGTVAVFVMFYVGAGAWIYNSSIEEEKNSKAKSKGCSSEPKYTRFQQ